VVHDLILEVKRESRGEKKEEEGLHHDDQTKGL